MKLRLKLFCNSLTFIAAFLMLSTASVGASAAPAANNPAVNEACVGVGLTSGNGCTDNGIQLSTTLGVIINIFSAIVGLVAVIMIIVAGLQFITANANPQNIAKARSSLLYAIVGLVVVVLAQVIVHFVINQASTAG